MNKNTLVIEEWDNVAIVLQEIKKGTRVVLSSGEQFFAQENIPTGHKISRTEILCGQDIIKYGLCIGRATKNIDKGYHVHVHNVEEVVEEVIKGGDKI